jgi:hypothetical protein
VPSKRLAESCTCGIPFGSLRPKRPKEKDTVMKVTSKLLFAGSLLSLSLILGACSSVPGQQQIGGNGSGNSGSGGGSGANSTFTIGGTVSGLDGTGLVLQDNGGDNLTIAGNGSFTSATSLATGKTYAVTVQTQPSNPQQTCSVSNGSGTVSANVTSVQVTCAPPSAIVSVTVTGLSGTALVLQDNGNDSLTINANGTFLSKTRSPARMPSLSLRNPLILRRSAR